MRHLTVTGQQSTIPSWMVKALVIACIAAMVTGVAAMASRLNANVGTHESRISVLEDHQKGIDSSLGEIKDGQREMNRKMDRLLARRQ